MPAALFGFTWWQLSTVSNALVGLASLFLVVLIVLPLVRLHQLRTNRLAMAGVVVFFLLGAQRILQVAYQVAGLLGDDAAGFAARQRNVWWLAVWQALLALVAIYFFCRRRAYTQPLIQAFLFDSFAERQRVEALEAEHALHRARAEAERDRDANAALLQAVINNSKSLITVRDLDGRFLMVNRTFEREFGVTQQELLGRTPDDVPAGPAGPCWASDQRASEGLVEYEETRPGPQGERIYEVTTFPLRDPSGVVYATCSIAQDVTEKKRVAELVSQARDAAVAANAAKSTFLATMSHEIRTPMNAVIGMTDLLLSTSLDEEQREFVDTVRTSGDALIAVINDILDFSKIEAGELRLEAEPFALRDEVESCLDFVVAAATRKGLDLVCYVDDQCPTQVVGDVVRIRQILANLLSNAVKFTEQGDVLVTVTSRLQPRHDQGPGDDRLPEGDRLPEDDSVVQDDRVPGADQVEVTLTVTDRGIGIDERGLERLFTSFTQVDASTTRVYGGTGLGLAISQRLAHAMGGSIRATSTPGVGSTFTCTLLLEVAADGQPAPLSAGSAVSSLVGRSVLVVDDNVTNLRILDLQLSGLGMRCTTAGTPATALALVAGGFRYDIALVDLNMPDLDGIELGRKLRGHPGLEHTPVVLLTSVGGRPAATGELFAAYLNKPVKSGVVRDLLVTLLDRQPDGPQHEPFPKAAVAPVLAPLRVLLAEDNLVNQRVAQLMLDRLGYPVDTVSTGQQAVNAVQSSRYDVVLMDLQMPEMDGLEAARHIVSEVPAGERPFLVAMTASALVEDREACTAAGMDSYLSKPVRARDLALLLADVPVSAG